MFDNCNSLHTNAYDEAITTPTEESVRRALAIQLIINKELGLAKNENPLQGSFIIEELTDLVEEAVLEEFDSHLRARRRARRHGAHVPALRIQEESLHYETLKHSGELPIVGVNTFLDDKGPTIVPGEVIRSTEEEKRRQVARLGPSMRVTSSASGAALTSLQEVARARGNVFEELMETVKDASLGQICDALFEVGGPLPALHVRAMALSCLEGRRAENEMSALPGRPLDCSLAGMKRTTRSIFLCLPVIPPEALAWNSVKRAEASIVTATRRPISRRSSGPTPCPAPRCFLRGPRASWYANRAWTVRRPPATRPPRSRARLLPPQHGGRPAGALGGLRPRHAPRFGCRITRASRATWARRASRSTPVPGGHEGPRRQASRSTRSPMAP